MDLNPIPPEQASRQLRRELHGGSRLRRFRAKAGPEKATAAEVGIAIAALTVGVLVAMYAIPAGIFLRSGMAVFTVLPFASIAVVLGLTGRKSAMGVTGMILGFMACAEACSFACYMEYKDRREEAARVAALEKERQTEAERRKVEEARAKVEEARAIQRQAEASMISARCVEEAARANASVENVR
jgi:hypothetical protein